jgi:alcohol dehydrogenase class IV
MDAFSHSIEALAVDSFHPMCDALAIAGIGRVAKYLERAVRIPDDKEAREQMMVAAMLGGAAFQKDLGAAHALAHALSSFCDMHHGLANALCIAAVMRYNIRVCPEKYARVATCFDARDSILPDEEAAEKAIEQVIALNSRIGIPRGLSALGVEEALLPELSKNAFEDICHQTNPRPCSKDSLLSLLRESM